MKLCSEITGASAGCLHFTIYCCYIIFIMDSEVDIKHFHLRLLLNVNVCIVVLNGSFVLQSF